MHYIQVKSILSSKNGMNLYRGCSHGCIYCDSRSERYGMDHDFEDIAVKLNAIELLENVLRKKRKKCMLATGCMSDPYMPLEARLKNTRKALLLAEKYGFGFTLLTKSDMVLRDMDVLKRINEKTKCVIQMTLTTYDEDLCRKIEPRVCSTYRRFEVLKEFKKAGIPTVVWISPILPYINDTRENIEGLISYCAEAGVYGIVCFGIGMTLSPGNREYFYEQLDRGFPGLKDRYIKEYANSYELLSPNSGVLINILRNRCKQKGIVCDNEQILKYMSDFEEKSSGEQLTLF